MALPPKITEPAMDAALFDIRHVIDIGLQAKRGTKPPRTSSRWTAGNLGYCLRRQFLDRAGVEVAEEFPLRTFWIGDLIHEGYQQMMRNAGILIAEELHLVDEELDLSGYVDMVWGGLIPEGLFDHEQEYKKPWQDFLVQYRHALSINWPEGFPVTGDELKSSNDYAARKMVSEGPNFHHLMQAATYGLILDRNPDQLVPTVDRWRLSIIDKSDGLMNVFEVRPGHTERALERVNELNDHWKRRELPPCTCGTQMVWEKNYCKFKDGDGCCDPHLVEKATSVEFWEGIQDVVVDVGEPDAPTMGTLTE